MGQLFPKYYIAYFGLCNIFKKIPCKHIPIFYETPCTLHDGINVQFSMKVGRSHRTPLTRQIEEAVAIEVKNVDNLMNSTRLPGAVPQPIGLFLFCFEFGWG